MRDDLLKAITDVCGALQALWQDSDFRPYYGSFETRRRVTTVPSDDAMRLPETLLPVRGTAGVEVKTSERAPTQEELTETLLLESFSPNRFDSSDNPKTAALRDKEREFVNVIDGIPGLNYRLYGSWGYKTTSLQEFQERRQGDGWDPIWPYSISLKKLVALSLTSAGFGSEDRASFSGWGAVADDLTQRLVDIAERTTYKYEARIFLNSPLVDSESPVPIAHLVRCDQEIEAMISYATDEQLTRLLVHRQIAAFDKINTAVTYSTEVPVETDEDAYLDKYVEAETLAELVLDALRLTRYEEDIGILGVEVVEQDYLTPSIRWTWANRYEASLAKYRPRRFDFTLASDIKPLSESEIEQLRRLISSLVGARRDFKGLDQALKRYRGSLERYAPSDPERLVEYAIALEAIFLNDLGKDRTELSYRLCMRLARFLEEDSGERRAIFKLAKDLYNFRSRVAHGDTLKGLKKAHEKRLEEALKAGPRLLSSAIVKILLSDGSPALAADMTSAWDEVDFG